MAVAHDPFVHQIPRVRRVRHPQLGERAAVRIEPARAVFEIVAAVAAVVGKQPAQRRRGVGEVGLVDLRCVRADGPHAAARPSATLPSPAKDAASLPICVGAAGGRFRPRTGRARPVIGTDRARSLAPIRPTSCGAVPTLGGRLGGWRGGPPGGDQGSRRTRAVAQSDRHFVPADGKMRSNRGKNRPHSDSTEVQIRLGAVPLRTGVLRPTRRPAPDPTRVAQRRRRSASCRAPQRTGRREPELVPVDVAAGQPDRARSRPSADDACRGRHVSGTRRSASRVIAHFGPQPIRSKRML